jgi:hypothetical protein
MPTSTSMSISQFLVLRVLGLRVSGVQGDRISGAPVGVAVGVAGGDARSSAYTRVWPENQGCHTPMITGHVVRLGVNVDLNSGTSDV